MLIVDPVANRIVEANIAACRLLGYERGLICSLAVSALHPGQLPALITFSEAILAKGAFWTRNLSARHAAGHELKLEYLGNVIPGEGRLILFTLNDLAALEKRAIDAQADLYVRGSIAEWHRAERLFRDIERENQLILRAAGEGIYGVNADGKTTFVNPAATVPADQAFRPLRTAVARW